MKTYKRSFLVIFLLLLLAAMVSGCKINGDGNAIEDYVEVTDIRVPASTVYLSSDGVTSSYQLQPTIVPANATNRKLIYYVAPAALDYFTVNESGLISAKKITEDEKLFIRIYSSTNKDAYALVSVVIENVDVQKIAFKQKEMKIQHDSPPVQLQLQFTPYHAQHGREVIYTCLDPSVLTVDNTGLVTVKKVGIATVVARGSTSGGKQVEGRTQITVSYAPGRYTLEATNQSPQFEQVVGDPQTISFSISRDLYDNIDLNPDIKWYVAGVRVGSQDGEWEFDYTPEKDSTPSPPYTIKAIILPKGENPIELESPPITLYKPFSGFTLFRNEPEGQKYYFNEQIVLEPLTSVSPDYYDWYIKDKGESGVGDYLGTSQQQLEDGKFEFTADRAGTFIVTAQAILNGVVVETKLFDFNIVKYVEGDKIQVIPQTNMEEKVPDGYDWYIHEYDIDVEDFKQGLLSELKVGTTIANSAYNYSALTEGWYVLSATPIVNSLPILEGTDDDLQPMRVYTQPFRVWKTDTQTDIEYLIIDGAKINNEYRPMIKWNATGGVNSFIVELFSNKQVYLIDTFEAEEQSGIIYRDYSIVLPLSIATLDQDFSVRIKKKGGVYSPTVNYVANSINAKYYDLFTEINYGINGYIRDIDELGELINYVTVYRPPTMLVENLNGISKYKATIATRLLYRTHGQYPVFTESPYEEDHITNIYNLIYGAINAFAIKEIKDIELIYNEIGDSYDVIMSLANETEYIYQQGQGVNNYDFDLNYATENRDDFDAFSLYAKATIEVSNSNELYSAVSTGKRPLPIAGSKAEEIYAEAKSVLNRILSFTMTPYEKVLAINDFLASEVENDKMLKEYSRLLPKPANLYLYDGYHLEGVFLHRKAVSLGKSKAFNLLCWMEGIPAILINGSKGEENHSWNKVKIGNNWYNIDTTIARAQRIDGSVVSYCYFLVSDNTMTKNGYEVYGRHYIADEDYDTTDTIAANVNIYSLEEIDLAIADFSNKIESGNYAFGMKFAESFVNQKPIRDIILERLAEMLSEDIVELEELLQSSDRYFIVLLRYAA